MLSNDQMSRLFKSQMNCLSHIDNQKILEIKKLLIFEVCKFMYKFSNSQLPKSLMNGFEKSKHDYPTRNSNIPLVPVHRSTIYNNSYVVKSIIEWLKIPNCIKTKATLKTFIKHLNVRLLWR